MWTQQAFRAFDHDFPSWATGVIIPHGIFDLARNRGHINIGLSHDTSQFACDSLRWYWNRIGQRCYPYAKSILLLCDCGGSNSAAQYLFKQDLQYLVNDLGIEIRVAHYPSYCSKFNPIERRFFPHVGRACQGMLFDTLDTVVRLMRKASTTTGLQTTVNVIHEHNSCPRLEIKDWGDWVIHGDLCLHALPMAAEGRRARLGFCLASGLMHDRTRGRIYCNITCQ